MTALGASAGVIARAGNARLVDAIALAVVLGVHAGASVPLVRVRLRRRERDQAGRAAVHVGVALGVAALLLVAIDRPLGALALIPRALSTAPAAWRQRPLRPARIGLEETILLAATVALIVGALRG